MKKTILITGAGSGIGRAAALYFSKKGWFTGLFDINEAAGAALGRQLGETCAFWGEMDVTCPESVKKGVEGFMEKTGNRLDLLFNSAGILFMGAHADLGLSRQKTTVDINLTGVLNLIHACLPALRSTPGSSVLTMSSASAVYGTPELAVYSATKHAVRGLTEALNIEFAPLDIHVGDIMVSFVRTPMVSGAATRATSLDRLGAVITPDAVAKTVFRAYHKRKVHSHIGGLLRLLILATTLFPFAKRHLVKALAFKPPSV